MNHISFVFGELKRHAPFTAFGAVTGLVIIGILGAGGYMGSVVDVSPQVFFILHPLHVFLSALVTTGIFKLNATRRNSLQLVLIGYIGSIGIATISDSLIPFLSEILLGLPNRELHIGVLEKPLITNTAAFLGIAAGAIRPNTFIPHFGHVLISTWASLFHVLMASGSTLSIINIIVISVFLFAAVWLPCCLSDIVFPLLFVPGTQAQNVITAKKNRLTQMRLK